MKKENLWSDRAKAPDPDDLSSEQAPGSGRETSHPTGRTNVDYTAMAHHEEIPDSSDTGDPSRPQGEFWHRNERAGLEGPFASHPEPHHEAPVTPTPESLEGQSRGAERPTIFFVDLRHKS